MAFIISRSPEQETYHGEIVDGQEEDMVDSDKESVNSKSVESVQSNWT